ERNQGYASMLSLFFNVLFVLFLLILANCFLIAVAQFVEYLVPLLAGPFRLAQTSQDVLVWLNAPLARLLTVRNDEAARDLALGQKDVWTYLPVWITPFLGWTLFVAVLMLTTFCI